MNAPVVRRGGAPPLPVTAPVPPAGGTLTGAGWTRRYAGAVMNTFGTPMRVLVRGEGCHVWDSDGTRYLDLLAGIAVNALGHAHPFLISTVTAQLASLGHVSNFFASVPQITLAERLLELLAAPEGARVFFTNSGTEANEAAFKLARRLAPPGERSGMVAAEGAFHGRSMGALALTHKPAYREPFEPLPPGVVHVPFGDVDALAAAITADVAAVVLEPIQGEAGVRMPPPGYLAAARRLTERAGVLLILDEVQTGIGRTGTWFAHQNPLVLGLGSAEPPAPTTGHAEDRAADRAEDLTPDVGTLAKGLGGGIPIGAMIACGPAASLLGPGSHGTTFGGNPVAAAAALATLHVIERDELMASAVAVGDHLRRMLTELAHPLIAGTRGSGLLIAVELTEPVAASLAGELLARGVIVNAPTPDVLRLAPPLILTRDQADEFVTALAPALDVVAGTG